MAEKCSSKLYCDMFDKEYCQYFIEDMAEKCGCVLTGTCVGVGKDVGTVMEAFRRLTNFIVLWYSNGYFPTKNSFRLAHAVKNSKGEYIVKKYLGVEDLTKGLPISEMKAVFAKKYFLERDLVLSDMYFPDYIRSHAKDDKGRYLDIWDIARDVNDVLDLMSKHYGLDYDKQCSVVFKQYKLALMYDIYFLDGRDDSKLVGLAKNWVKWLQEYANSSYPQYKYLIGTMVNPVFFLKPNDDVPNLREFKYLHFAKGWGGYVGIHPSLW